MTEKYAILRCGTVRYRALSGTVASSELVISVNFIACSLGAFVDPGDGSISAHYATFLFMIFSNPLSYGMNAANLGVLFPVGVFGRLVGITNAASGLTAFLPILLYSYMISRKFLERDF